MVFLSRKFGIYILIALFGAILAEEKEDEQLKYRTPVPKGNTYFAEPFDSEELGPRWVVSEARKDGAEESVAKYDGKWEVEEAMEDGLRGDLGLVLKSRAKHHAIAATLDKIYKFQGEPFIVQYEVKFQNGQECGGGYIKLLSEIKNLNLKSFYDKTPYTIMFGPDRCGSQNKLHFIFRHKNPINGSFEEKHAKVVASNLENYFTDKKSHLYTLVIKPDNTYQIYLDQNQVNSGNLLEDFSPPVNPPNEIEDPNDKKPDDWDEKEKIADPEAKKPEDWDESAPRKIPDENAVKPEGWLDNEEEYTVDPDAKKPDDWDEEMDGEWEPPKIKNPKCDVGCGEWKRPLKDNPNYKGKWHAPLIDNPNYKGKWKPRKISNPDYFEDLEPYKMTSIAAVGLELWSISDNIMFDNFIITDDKWIADAWAEETWEIKHRKEMGEGGDGVISNLIKTTNERPWLWAVYIIVILLPLVLIITFCCTTSKDKSAEVKKTDAVVEDDKIEELDPKENEEKVEEIEKDEENDENKDNEAREEKESNDNDNSQSDGSKVKKATKADLETNEADESDALIDDSGDSPRKSPRRRNLRKE